MSNFARLTAIRVETPITADAKANIVCSIAVTGKADQKDASGSKRTASQMFPNICLVMSAQYAVSSQPMNMFLLTLDPLIIEGNLLPKERMMIRPII
jgi:hypothetical protein